MNTRTEQWVQEQVKDCGRRFGFLTDHLNDYANKTFKTLHFYSSNSNLILTINKNRISIVGTGKKNAGRIGVSQCSANDEFDPRIGIALAWARYKGAAIPIAFAPAPRVDTVELGCKVRYAGKKYRVKDCTKRGVYVETKKGKIKLLPPETRVEVIF